ncbi:MAG: HD domain-containing protein [Anaerolineaceae bacterium]|nr:HD domain-containing protein [Anaerolineaceae bacterium]
MGSEKNFQKVIDIQSDYICGWNRSGKLIYANAAFCEYFRVNKEDIINLDTFKLVTREEWGGVKKHIKRLSIDNPHESYLHQGVNPEGQTISWIQWNLHAEFDPVGKLMEIHTVGKDITGSIQTEVEIAHHKEKENNFQFLSLLRGIGSAIANNQDLTIVIKKILNLIIQNLEIDAAIITIINPYTETLEYSDGVGEGLEGIRFACFEHNSDIEFLKTLEEEYLIIDELSQPPSGFNRAEMLVAEGFNTAVILPIVIADEFKACIEIYSKTPILGKLSSLRLLMSLKNPATIAIGTTELITDLIQMNNELMVTYDSTLEGWAKALELRDRETAGHTMRVTDMTVGLAALMNIPTDELVHIRRGAILHDIGKMGVPDEILLKEGSLSDEEWVVMRQHTTFAYDMISEIFFLDQAIDIPFCHHEHWDGTGYPQGLKGEEIPLPARIFAVVDIFDALTSDRPYRKAWDIPKAVAYIKTLAGNHLDPGVVDVFTDFMGIQQGF